MATKAIDKLRIQGNAAPRRGSDFRRPFHHPAFHDADAASHFVYQADTGSVANGSDVTTIVHSHPSSAASRRHDHLQRVQQANRGLTSTEAGSLGREGLPSIRFLLQGKPVSGDEEATPWDGNRHQRVGHYKTSAKEVYRARHRMPSELTSSGDQTNVFRAIRTPLHDVDNNAGGNALPFTGHFYLGPAPSGPTPNQTWTGGKGEFDLSPSGHGIFKPTPQCDLFQSSQNPYNDTLAWHDSGTTKELTYPLHTPRASPQDEAAYIQQGDSYFNTNAARYFNGMSSMPDMMQTQSAHVGGRHHRQNSTWSRRNVREQPRLKSDLSSLKQCLHVLPSYQTPLRNNASPRDMVRLKHCPQAKVNYNNPYRNMRSKERREAPGSAGRYMFNSVESYIHFNKIYPRASELQCHSDPSLGSRGQLPNGLPNIPRVNGFTSHCTDTVLLKMMFEMNKPKSGKSTSKYSDVAVHKDLDEFMIVSTPTVSRSPSVVSRNTPARHKARSQVSFASCSTKPKEDDEEKATQAGDKIKGKRPCEDRGKERQQKTTEEEGSVVDKVLNADEPEGDDDGVTNKENKDSGDNEMMNDDKADDDDDNVVHKENDNSNRIQNEKEEENEGDKISDVGEEDGAAVLHEQDEALGDLPGDEVAVGVREAGQEYGNHGNEASKSPVSCASEPAGASKPGGEDNE